MLTTSGNDTGMLLRVRSTQYSENTLGGVKASLLLTYKTKQMNYKEYEIDTKGNGYGYFEATSLNDCDANIIYANTIEKVKVEIDELYLD